MISLHEQNTSFSQANEEMLIKSKKLFAALADKGESHILSVNEDACSEGFDPSKIYFIKQGVLATFCQDAELYMLQDNDIFMPEFIPNSLDDHQSDFRYNIKFALHVESFTPKQLSEAINGYPKLIQLWLEINCLQRYLCNQTMAVLSPNDGQTNPQCDFVSAGEIIIQENDEADYVFTLMDGRAVVIHNNVQVAVIKKDEIFGAIAVLLNQKRIATVKAETNCMVLKIHREEFSKMVHSHPNLFLSLLENLADNIKSMNIKVSEAAASD